MLNLKKKNQIPRSTSKGKKYWCPTECLVTRNTHVKHQDIETQCTSKVMLLARLYFCQNSELWNRMSDSTKAYAS